MAEVEWLKDAETRAAWQYNILGTGKLVQAESANGDKLLSHATHCHYAYFLIIDM